MKPSIFSYFLVLSSAICFSAPVFAGAKLTKTEFVSIEWEVKASSKSLGSRTIPLVTSLKYSDVQELQKGQKIPATYSIPDTYLQDFKLKLVAKGNHPAKYDVILLNHKDETVGTASNIVVREPAAASFRTACSTCNSDQSSQVVQRKEPVAAKFKLVWQYNEKEKATLTAVGTLVYEDHYVGSAPGF